MPVFFDALAKFSAIGILLSAIVVILSYGDRQGITRWALLMAIVSICFLLSHGNKQMRVPGDLGTTLLILSSCLFIVAWRFGLEVFDEYRSSYQAIWWAGVSSHLIFVTVATSYHYDLYQLDVVYLKNVLSVHVFFMLALMAHLALRAYLGQDNDLLERRRKYRSHFALLLAVLLFVILFIDEVSHADDPVIVSYLSLAAPVVAMSFLLWALKLYPETIGVIKLSVAEVDGEVMKTKPTVMDAQQRKLTCQGLEQHNQQLCQVLEQKMLIEKVYREHGLTVSELANRMKTSEKQLRILINQTLGYRNFSSYLNSFRLEEAKSRLEHDYEYKLPILTIALDVGFASISPFNAAFKDYVGVTPSQYRKNARVTTATPNQK